MVLAIHDAQVGALKETWTITRLGDGFMQEPREARDLSLGALLASISPTLGCLTCILHLPNDVRGPPARLVWDSPRQPNVRQVIYFEFLSV